MELLDVYMLNDDVVTKIIGISLSREALLWSRYPVVYDCWSGAFIPIVAWRGPGRLVMWLYGKVWIKVLTFPEERRKIQ